jgi:hypothetical protein
VVVVVRERRVDLSQREGTSSEVVLQLG